MGGNNREKTRKERRGPSRSLIPFLETYRKRKRQEKNLPATRPEDRKGRQRYMKQGVKAEYHKILGKMC